MASCITCLSTLDPGTDLTVCPILQYNPKRPTLLVDQIVERVLHKLKALGRVPRHVTLGHDRRPAAWTLGRMTKRIIGREAEIEAVLASLQQHGAAVIWGGPGEGKTSIAMEAAARLRVAEPYLSAFELDMHGKRPCTKVVYGWSCAMAWKLTSSWHFGGGVIG